MAAKKERRVWGDNQEFRVNGTHTTTYKIQKQQGPTIWQEEPLNIL